jgi:hypothetical protein
VALAGLALLLLPGLLVVRAPWTALAPLSLAFWVVSAWWPPFDGPGRSRAVTAALVASLLLALLRLLPKHVVDPPPGWQPPPVPPSDPRPGLDPPPLRTWPSLWVVAAAVALLAPVPLWQNAPGQRLAFQTTSARLFLWYDGIPTSGEPLLPLEPMGAHAPAVATLVADLSALSGIDPGRAAPWVAATAAALALVGLFSLLATKLEPEAAALGALVALALPPWPAFLSAWGDGEALVALALVLPAAALVVGHASRSSAVAASLLLAAGALAQPALTALALCACAAVVVARSSRPDRQLRRLAAILVLALGLAGPGLWRLARTLSLGEAAAILRAARAGELAWFGFWVLGAWLAPIAARTLLRDRSRLVRSGVAFVALLLLLVRVHGWFAAGQLDAETRAALAAAAVRVPPLEAICARDDVRDFVPALAGRRAGEPGAWVPPVYSEEWASRKPVPCSTTLENRGRVR